jgi:hypothetical protein
MKYAKKLSFFILIILYAGCDKNGVGFIEEEYLQYPTQLHNEWEYSTVFSIEILDTLGNIDSIDTRDSTNTIVKIIGINETIDDHPRLTRFESYDLITPQFIHTMWYLNSDSSLAAIAYKNAGSSHLVYPKISEVKKYEIIDSIFSFSLLPAFTYSTEKISVDTILFYSPERIVIKYPVKIGSEWVELISPFYRKRFINQKENIQTNLGIISCYKIDSEMNFENLKLIDYLSVEYGLIKREIISDSIKISTADNPEGIGWANMRTTSVLVRVNLNK